MCWWETDNSPIDCVFFLFFQSVFELLFTVVCCYCCFFYYKIKICVFIALPLISFSRSIALVCCKNISVYVWFVPREVVSATHRCDGDDLKYEQQQKKLYPQRVLCFFRISIARKSTVFPFLSLAHLWKVFRIFFLLQNVSLTHSTTQQRNKNNALDSFIFVVIFVVVVRSFHTKCVGFVWLISDVILQMDLSLTLSH